MELGKSCKDGFPGGRASRCQGADFIGLSFRYYGLEQQHARRRLCYTLENSPRSLPALAGLPHHGLEVVPEARLRKGCGPSPGPRSPTFNRSITLGNPLIVDRVAH
ncbi:hypothetical protein GWK47_051623 [Chionoecetes opilio]|uniref:Uncharacterized protein n=1 Tax=Chionoecetes opilio TaxID=41210 RepID=A0A8J4YCM6_CHIOP|nr:hypothetical protein GWK47_051623 [Chionoecetes opilio]